MAVDIVARGMASEALSGGGGGGSSTLAGLTDVDISNPTDGQTLVYNATSEKWENGESAGVGVLFVSKSQDTLSMTWQQIYDAAIDNDMLVILRNFDEDYGSWYIGYLTQISSDPEYNEYIVRFGEAQFMAQSASGYPVQNYT